MATTETSSHRREVVCFLLAGLLLLLGAVGFPWWHVINSPEPGYVRGCRLLSLLFAALTLIALLRPARRTGLLMVGGLSAVALPLLVLLTITTLDAPSISAAVHQTNQAGRLIIALAHTDVNPQVAWTNQRGMGATAIVRNDYTLVDALETASFFAKPGWYVGLIGGLLLLIAAWLGEPQQARRWLFRRRWLFAGTAVVLGLLVFGRLAVANYYWNRGREAQARADYAAALYDYRKAMQWDRRQDYDLAFHFELGRLYGRLGMTDEPDYWASIGEVYLNTNLIKMGYEIFRRNILNPYANPALRVRYANTLLKMGEVDYLSKLPGSAINRWQRAIEVDPDNVEIMYALGLGYTRVGNYPRAIHWWRELIRANESVGLFRIKYVASFTYRKVITARAWSFMSWCYYQQHDYATAMQCAAFSTQQGSSNPDATP